MSLISTPPALNGEYLCFHKVAGFGVYGYLVGYGFGNEGITHWDHLPPKPYVERSAMEFA